MEIWHIGSLTSEKAKQIWPQTTWLCRKNSRAFGGLGGPQTPPPNLLLGLRHTAFGTRPSAARGLQPATIFRYFLQDLVSSLPVSIWRFQTCLRHHRKCRFQIFDLDFKQKNKNLLAFSPTS